MNEYVWVASPKGEFPVPIGAQILASFESRIKVRDDNNNEYWITTEQILRPMHPTSISGVDDMITLAELQEYTILRNIQIRYEKNDIYTYIGFILVAVNPYKQLTICDKSKMVEYRKKSLGKLPPHIFAVADHSYECMQKNSEKRCIIISGESGAGKTESTKLFLQYFASISPKRSGIERQILDSNPILEAFGNAKTHSNDNSSRFGKYVAINFNLDGSIKNAQIRQYLLEKSRIVSQNMFEHNYHIFYTVLSGMSEEEKLQMGLKNASHYKYLNQDEKSFTHETNPIYAIEKVKLAFKTLNFSSTEVMNIFELICGILHFGNIQYNSISVSNTEAVEVTSENEVDHICKLLKISRSHLIHSLTKKSILTQGDEVEKFLSQQEAIDSRDAFVKKIYENLFNFIVEKINEALSKFKEISNTYIGILDIFGFEVFDRNSFEQLCINYANERLQQYFLMYIFKAEQEQYAIEGIDWTYINFPDNRDVLELIEDGTGSILSVINDESKFPQSTDQTMLYKLIELHSENYNFFKPKYKKTEVFGIKHYAGVVLYDVKGFLEKNRDACTYNFKKTVSLSESAFLKKIFSDDFKNDSDMINRRKTDTLALKFKNSLDLLMSELNQCEPFFIRCIKPNNERKPQKFDRMLCCQQLRNAGITETTKIRMAGYSSRYDYVQFVQRYRILFPGTPLAHQVNCKKATINICQRLFQQFPKANYQFGHTKIFLKYCEERYLECERDNALFHYVVMIQKIVRGWLQRRRYKKLKETVLILENKWIKNHFQSIKMNDKIYNLKLKSKFCDPSLEFQYHRFWITRFQAYCRGYLVRKLTTKRIQKLKLKKQKAILQKESSCGFKKFAQEYFHKKSDYRFSKKPLKNSLTHLVKSDDVIASKALWLTILRYTKNISEPKKADAKVPIYILLREIFERIKKVNKASLYETNEGSLIYSTDTEKLYENWLKTPSNDLQKLYFIISHGIERPELRDEIYCQICKVMTKNQSQKGVYNAWELLCSCTGCFPPSDLFLNHLKSFIRTGSDEYNSYCLFRLHRTLQNGTRTHPPCLTELKAIKQLKPVNLKIFLMDGTFISTKIDSATNAKELLDMVAKNINLIDSFGFSIVLAQEIKQMSIGDGSNFVLDAIAECEQYAIDADFENLPWKLYLKKEMFAPWHDCSVDEVSTKLICFQISEGIKSGEYKCSQKDLEILIAQLCYVDRGRMQSLDLNESIKFYIPNYIINSSQRKAVLSKAVKTVYEKMFSGYQKPNYVVRADIIKYAIENWSLEFSKLFSVFGTVKNKNSFSYPESLLVAAVNSSGISIIDETNEKRLIVGLEYSEIQEIIRKESAETHKWNLKIITFKGMEISVILHSSNTVLYELLMKILDTLKNYSQFVISTKNYKNSDRNFLELEKGDLISLSHNFTGRDLLCNSWAEGHNSRNGKVGHFLLDCVEIIPTIKQPAENIVEDIRNASFSKKKMPLFSNPEKLKHYTLQSYADKYFSGNVLESQNQGFPALWKYSQNKITKPLHKNLEEIDDLFHQALEAFESILVYMKDMQMEVPNNDEYFSSKIMNFGIQNVALRDELYCQVMKQITSNPNRESEYRGWELMWMITGLFACSEVLAVEVKKFLQSRRIIQTARECLARFNKILFSEPRKYPPYSTELEAVKHRPCRILYKVYFPDESHKFFSVESLTKVKDLIKDILNRLMLNSSEDFNLFVQIKERLFCIPEDCYFFDYLQHLKKWTDKCTAPKNSSFVNFQLFFMKICWRTVFPGQDTFIDSKFIYPQEYDKYLNGFYDIPLRDVVYLASLIYQVHSSAWKGKNFLQILKKMIPSKFMDTKTTEEWQKNILSMDVTYKEEYAKIKFLEYLYNHPSYGSLYFTVKDTKSNLPEYILYPITCNPQN